MVASNIRRYTDDQTAAEVNADTTQFTNNLSDTDLSVQASLETIDAIDIAPEELPEFDSSNAGEALVVNTAGDDVEWEDIEPNFDLPDALGTAGQILAVNSLVTDVAWVNEPSGTVPTFDTGDADRVLAVNAAGTAAIWVDAPAGTVPDSDTNDAGDVLTVNSLGNAAWADPSMSMLDLTDTPSAYDSAGEVLAVNSSTDGLFLGDIAIALTITQDDTGLTITATASVE